MWYEWMAIHAVQSVVQCFTYEYSWLSRVYVTVNAFRTMFPVKIVERECFTEYSSPFIVRSLATVAELCFAGQLAIQLRDSSILCYAVVAQLCCWLGMLTQNNACHVYEEFLWFLIGYTIYRKSPRLVAKTIAFFYCCYMLFMDIPMYMTRWREQEDHSWTLHDVHDCVKMNDFRDEYLWRTGYFVGASRLSMLI